MPKRKTKGRTTKDSARRKSFDANSWNLEGLALKAEFEKRGRIRAVVIPNPKSPVKRIGFLRNGRIVLLRPDNRRIEVLEIGTVRISALYEWREEEDVVDVSVVGANVYLFDQRGGTITRTSEELRNAPIAALPRWSVATGDLSLYPNMVVAAGRAGQNDVAYLLSKRGEQIISVELSGRGRTSKVHSSSREDAIGVLGSQIGLANDVSRGSLIVADADHHRVVEISCETGIASTLCGSGKAGQATEEQPAAAARLSHPSAAAVYRATDYLSEDVLAESTRRKLDSLPEREWPRIILVADTGNRCIRRLTQVPAAMARVGDGSVEHGVLRRFLGSGGEMRIDGSGDLAGDDLGRLAIHAPTDIAVSPDGEVVVKTGDQHLVVLQPASVVGQIRAVQAVRKKGLEET